MHREYLIWAWELDLNSYISNVLYLIFIINCYSYHRNGFNRRVSGTNLIWTGELVEDDPSFSFI